MIFLFIILFFINDDDDDDFNSSAPPSVGEFGKVDFNSKVVVVCQWFSMITNRGCCWLVCLQVVASATRAGAAPPAASCAPPAPTATAAAAPAPASTVGHVTQSAGSAPAPPVSRATPANEVERLLTQRHTNPCIVFFVCF